MIGQSLVKARQKPDKRLPAAANGSKWLANSLLMAEGGLPKAWQKFMVLLQLAKEQAKSLLYQIAYVWGLTQLKLYFCQLCFAFVLEWYHFRFGATELIDTG